MAAAALALEVPAQQPQMRVLKWGWGVTHTLPPPAKNRSPHMGVRFWMQAWSSSHAKKGGGYRAQVRLPHPPPANHDPRHI